MKIFKPDRYRLFLFYLQTSEKQPFSRTVTLKVTAAAAAVLKETALPNAYIYTANLKAPVAINIKTKMARQCVLQNNKLEIREPIFNKLQQRVVTHNPESIKSQVSGWGVAVRFKDSPPKKGEPEAGL